MPIDDTEGFKVKVMGSENLIRNSNGNYWDPLSENIQVAIDDQVASEKSGTVWLPNETFMIDQQTGESGYPCGLMLKTYDTLYQGAIKEGVTLDMGDAIFIPSGNFNVVEMGLHSSIKNGYIQVGPVPNYDKAMLFIDGKKYHYQMGRNSVIERMNLSACDHSVWTDPVCPYKGIGIHMFCDNNQQINRQGIGFFRINNIKTLGLECDIFLQNTNDGHGQGAWINSNVFSDLFLSMSKNNIRLQRDTNVTENACATSGNCFDRIHAQTSTAYVSQRGYQETCILADGWGNVFNNLMLWDWGKSQEQGYTAITLTFDTRQCFLMGRYRASLINNGHPDYPNIIIDQTYGTVHGCGPC